MARGPSFRVGLISDTHGLLRPEACEFLRGSSRILHGGDIGNQKILDELSQIAPVTAVRGNNDTEPWAGGLAQTELVRFGEVSVYLIHNLGQLDLDPIAARVNVIVCGHSHQPRIDERNGVLYINPGSAGPRRFKLPVAVAELNICARDISSRIVELGH